MSPEPSIYDVQLESPRLVLRPPPPPGSFDGAVWRFEISPAERVTLYLAVPAGHRPSVTIVGRRRSRVTWERCEDGRFRLVLSGIPKRKSPVEYKLRLTDADDGEVGATTVRVTPPGKGDLGAPP